ncbi:LysR family transcriptional regulator [Vibrio agarivorans]|uniref:LysR family transcriptional regulator n=1 Tax=Vibrio agarivorans TaxID=153622 RepID=UPI00222F3F48|nr:LysR family transcriptional regulator [Vibrio agarivorans]MDN3660343.1 LysR family transcriptional regulator [Vibrio agarivorans]
MALSIEQLQAFVATVEQKGIAQAARHLGKHVTTVREQVNNFEIDTGLTLFERHARSLEVTPHGLQLYKYAISMLSEATHFELKIDSLLKGVPDRMTVAIETSLVDRNLDLVLAEILNKYPYLNLKVLNGDTLQVRGWVMSGRADVGLVFSAINMVQEIEVKKAYSFDVVRVVPKQWQLPKNATDRDFADKLQLTYSFLSDLGLKSADIVSHRHMVCNNAFQMLNLVKTGVGWGHLPGFICKEATENNDVVVFPDEFANWNAEVILQQGASINPAMKMFIDAVCGFGHR